MTNLPEIVVRAHVSLILLIKGRQKCLFRKKGKSKVVRRSNASAGEGLFVVKNR